MRDRNTDRPTISLARGQMTVLATADQPAQGGPALIERYWPVAVLGVFLAWGSASYIVYTSLGWFGRGLTATSLIMAATVAVLFIRGAMRPDGEIDAAELAQDRRAA